MSRKPSYAPVLMAAGLMLTLWGAVTTWLISCAGLIVVVFAARRWIRDAGEPRPADIVADESVPARARVKEEAARRLRFPMTTSPWLHRYAVLLTVLTLALVVDGALVTSNLQQPAASLRTLHFVNAALVALLALTLATWLRGLAWLLLVAVAIEAALGGASAVVGTVHAFLAQLTFAGSAAIALITAPAWNRPADPLPDSSRLSLRNLSLVSLALLILQVGLGAAYRHNAMGIVPHIVGALVLTILLLLLAVLVTNQFPEHSALRPVAKLLIGITFTQVMLGMAAFITRLMMAQGSLPVVIIGVAHVTNGSLTLGTTVVLTLLIRRYVRAA